MADSSPLIPKHHVPGVDIATVWCWVRASTFRDQAFPAMNTLLSACPWVDRGGATQFDTYQFRGFDAMDEGTDRIRAMFVPDLSGSASTPVRTYDDSEESFYWPAVLTGIDFDHFEYNPSTGVWSFGGSPTQFSNWSVKPKLINAYHGLTKITVRDYISDLPFTGIATEGLHPTRVHWELAGKNGVGSVPECLTAQVNVPEVKLDGTISVINAARTIDATPQTSWTAHVFSDRVTFADGLYFRRTKTAAVPPHTPGES